MKRGTAVEAKEPTQFKSEDQGIERKNKKMLLTGVFTGPNEIICQKSMDLEETRTQL